MTVLPITTFKSFKENHLAFDGDIKHYSITKRGREAIPDDVLADLADRAATSLKAMNARARIEFCRTALQCFKRAIFPTRSAPAFSLTLTPERFVIPASEAHLYDWSEVQAWAEQMLEGLDYVGIVDAAPYSNTPKGRERVVSWHVHVLVWGCRRDRISELVARINDENRALLPGRGAAHSRALLSWKSIKRKILYLLKAPLRTYRVYPIRDNDGRVTGRWQQKKFPHRPGEAAFVCRFMYGAEIDKLCFSGGKGIALLEQVTTAARDRLASIDRRRNAAIIKSLHR